MSEQAIAEGIQDVVQTIAAFDDDSVVISDWGILDGSLDNAPYLRIDVSEDMVHRQDAKSITTTWYIPAMLMVEYTDWDTSMIELRNRRQDIVDAFVGTNRSPGSDSNSYTDLKEIRTNSPVVLIYDHYVEKESDAEPIMLGQELIFEVDEGD